jgi:hypothetical protein
MTLRQLALNALAHRAGPGAGAAAVAAAAQRAYDDLALVSIPLIGQVGVDALTGRTLFLAQRQYPWLAHTPEPDQWKGPFTQIVFCLEQQTPAVAMDAASAVLTTLTELIITFIGNPLTERVLQQAWPEAFSEADFRRHKA